MDVNQDYIDSQRLLYYSTLCFFRGKENLLVESVRDEIFGDHSAKLLEFSGEFVTVWIKKLDWDTSYFKCPTFKIEFIGWKPDITDPRLQISRLLETIKDELKLKYQRYYLFTEVPSEDITVLQSLGMAEMQLIETRLTYFFDLTEMSLPSELPLVRIAQSSDISNLRKVAKESRNNYDRFHADPFFSTEIADEFLAEYVEQCVKGLVDVVLVPSWDDEVPDAFICGAKNIDKGKIGSVGRLVLVAVGQSRSGSYRQLNQLMMQWMREQGMSTLVNTTQSTNRAVIHVCETLGYQFGRASHIYATY